MELRLLKMKNDTLKTFKLEYEEIESARDMELARQRYKAHTNKMLAVDGGYVGVARRVLGF